MLNGGYVTEDLRGRHGDAVWRIRWGEEWLYVAFPEMHDLQEAYEMITNRFEEWKGRRREGDQPLGFLPPPRG